MDVGTNGASEVGGWPRPRTSFVGRESELEETVALLEGGVGSLTLVGPGGIGKTRLALAVAERLNAAVTGEPAYVALAAVRDPSLVLPAIAEAVGARVDERGALAGIVERIGMGRRLLLLDNLERLVAAGEDLVRLREACPGVGLLMTSRVPLGVPGERVLDVGPLPPPEEGVGTDPASIRENPAVRLFLDRARAARPDFVACDADVLTIGAICRRLDGIPLAIELAAARVTVLPPPALLTRLERRLPVLVGRRSDVPDRLRTMRDAIAWSYDLLEEQERALFRRLSVFEGGFFLTEAEAIAAGWSPDVGYPFAGGQRVYGQAWEEQQGKEPPQACDGAWLRPALPRLEVDVLAGLETLVEQRLIRPVEPVAGDARFELLETIREYGREKLERTGDAPAVEHAHAALVLARTEAAGWGIWGRDRRHWLALLEADLANYREATAWLATQPAAANQLSLRLAETLWHFWLTRGRIAEGRRYLDAALARPGGTAKARAAAGHVAGYLALMQGDARRARESIEEALELSRSTGYRIGEARCHFFLALVDWNDGNQEGMYDHARIALALYGEEADRVGIGTSLIVLAMIARGGGRLDDAEAFLAEAAARCGEAGFGWGVATSAYYRGELARVRDDDEQAAVRLREGLHGFRDQGDPVGMAGCLSGLATIAGRHDDDERAARLFAAAGKLAEGATGFLPPTDRTEYDAAFAAVRERLGEEAFVAAVGLGYAMPIEHVVAEAELVDGRPARRRSPHLQTGEVPTAKSLGLTQAQFEVLQMLVRGVKVKHIAERLSLSEKSVYGRIERLKDRLHAASDAELIAFAINHGLR
jgi:predicted ATPase/DNA-binding CsgD family transcriptional regulator